MEKASKEGELDFILSKSKYISGLQCLKLLHITVHDKERIPDFDIETEFRFQQGNEVGEAARKRFTEGIFIEKKPWDTVLERTREAIDSGATAVFEATFLYDGIIVRVDVLRKFEDDTFDIIEVKQSTKLKDEHIPDLAIQRYVLEGAGPKINNTYLMHLSRDHIHPDQGELFEIEDCTDEVDNYLPEIQENIKKQKDTLKLPTPPVIDIGPHCTDPWECSLYDECWEHIPDISIFNIPGFKAKWLMYKQGCVNIDDLPEEYIENLNVKGSRYVSAVLNNEPVIDREDINSILKTLDEPIYFMDFETIMWAIPRYEGTRPYDQVPFQWSVHKLTNGELEHSEFLWDQETDPRPEFLRTLLEAVGKKGSIMVCYVGFERTRLKELAQHFPKKKKEIADIIDRLWDIQPIFKKHYTHPEAGGRAGLKFIVPAVCPHLSYGDLDVQGGMEAAATFAQMIQEEGEEKGGLKKGLLEYCKLDTFAMVELLKELKKSI